MISRAQLVRAAGLTVFLLMSTNTLGFKIIKPPIHEDITRRGLSTVIYEVPDSKLMFTSAVMDEIANANRLVDLQYALDPERHFDNEFLLESLTLISQLKKNVVDALKSRPYFSAFAAREYLGEAMHTMQDFYSHSTWVESGNSNIVNFYNLVSALDFEESPIGLDDLKDFRRNPMEIGTVCSPGTGDIVFGGRLTTGYFEIIGDDIPEDLRSIGKCIHGTPFSCSTEGINKDKDCPHNSSAHFLAKGIAIKETQAFTQSIVDELAANDHIDGICALMGIDREACPQEEPEVVTGTLASTCTVDSEFITGQNLASLLDSDTTYFCNICNTNEAPLFSLFFNFGASRIGFSTREQYVADVNVLDDGYEMVVERHILDDGSYFGDKTLYGSRWRVSSLARTSGDRNYLCGNLQATVQDTTIDAEALYCSTSNNPSNRGSCDL